MAINLNTNFGIFAPNPIDDRYLSERTSGGSQLPYSGVTEVTGTTGIPESRRYEGLTVLIQTGSTAIEYWFNSGVADTDLEEKKYASEQLVGDFVTGATNLGYFSGTTSVQTLTIAGSAGSVYNGDYLSIYNYYYRDGSNVIRIGKPTYSEPFRRAYYNSVDNKSWVWDVNTGGWRFVDEDIRNLVGETSTLGYDYGPVYYTVDEWSNTGGDGSGYYSSGSSATVTVTGSLTTGDIITVGAPPYSYFGNSNLYFRTIKSSTPNLINVGYVDDFITISGTSGVSGATNGLTLNGQDIGLGGTISSATTLTLSGASASLIITDDRTIPTGIQYGDDYSNTYTARSLVDAEYVTGFTSAASLVKNVCNPTVSPYNVVSTDFYIGVSGGTVINLDDAENNGQIIIVSDIVGNADTTDYIQINAGSALFVGGFSMSCIDTPFGSMTYLYNGAINRWVVIGFSNTPV